MNVQVFVFCPPLEQAPDHTVSRLLLTVSVIDVPVVNEAAPEVPTTTLMPAGVEVTRSPLRPVAVTVSVEVDCAGVTVSDAVRVTLPAFAVIVTGVDVVTAFVVIEKVALVAPCGTLTVAGTDAAALLLESVTANPLAGAVPLSVMVACDVAPPVTIAGLALRLCRVVGGGTGVTFRVAVFVMPLYVAVIVTGVLVATVDVAIGNVALNEPAGTVTLAGRLATDALLLDSDTAAPTDGAPDVSVTVPVEPLPPTTLAGLALTEDIAGGEGGAVPTVSFVTNASAQKIRRSPLKTRSRAPAVVGKSDDNVCPVRYSAPSVPRAMALANSEFVPPRKVE